MKNSLLLVLTICLTNCIGYYKIPRDSNGERVINDKANYSFNSSPSAEDFRKIDTSAFYVQVFEGRYYNEQEMELPRFMIFHKDGFFQENFVRNYPDRIATNKNSIRYGGKYRIVNQILEIEEFLPSRGGETSLYSRSITKARIVGDKIYFDLGTDLVSVFQKRGSLK